VREAAENRAINKFKIYKNNSRTIPLELHAAAYKI
jgi:hypothetical protein